jgi:hypothetical protein
MARRKRLQSDPTIMDGRQIVYDRQMFLAICVKWLRGERIEDICAKPPMPTVQLFLAWVDDHEEAREVYHCARHFKSRWELGLEHKHLPDLTIGDWERVVREKLERGYPLDYRQRKYIPPDWNKVYPRIGGPAVWPTENRKTYDDLLNQFTQMIKPRDLRELSLTKEAADAMWEWRRLQHQKALPGCTFAFYRALDIAQSRAIKRRDNALRQIERWRAGLGGKADALPVEFIADDAVAKHYAVEKFFSEAKFDHSLEDLSLLPSRAGGAPAGAVSDRDADRVTDGVNRVGWLTGSQEYSLVRNLVQERKVVPAEQVCAELAAHLAVDAKAAPPLAPADEVGQAAPAISPAQKASGAASPRAGAGEVGIATDWVTNRVSWIGWLTGIEDHPWHVLEKAARQNFKQAYPKKQALVRNLVTDRKLVPPHRVCPELADLLAPSAKDVPPPIASREDPK